jgi:vancomycin resistance protein YoaR
MWRGARLLGALAGLAAALTFGAVAGGALTEHEASRTKPSPPRIGDRQARTTPVPEAPPQRGAERVPSKRHAAELERLGIRELVGSFTTHYPAGEPRVVNIQRAAALLDEAIISAGARFSLNEALGELTIERGFVSAPTISGGRVVDSVGGGISQVATTLYNAAFFAGLELVEHTPHSFYIDRYPVGREATISWGGPELVFRNDWPAAVLMRVGATATSVTVRLYSSLLDRRVESWTGNPYAHVAPVTRELPSATLPAGTRLVVQEAGAPGFTVDYTRRVLRGATLVRNERFRVTYQPKDAIVEVGVARRGGP